MTQMVGTPTNIEIGPCQVTFNAIELGFFSGGVTWEYTIGWVDITADQSTMLLDRRIQSERLVVTVPMLETTLDMLVSGSHSVVPTATRQTSSTKRLLQIGGHQVAASDAKALIITPLTDGAQTLSTDDNLDIRVHKAFPAPQLKKSYTMGEVRIIPVEFHAIADITKDSGDMLFELGDSTTV